MTMLKAFERTPKLAELKVSYRRGGSGRGKRAGTEESPFFIRDSKSCETYFRRIWNKDTIELREEFIVLCLNTSHEVLGWVNVASGGLDSTTVDPRIIFGVALQTASSAIIVAHNHPSGSPKPSAQDIAVTQQLREGGKMLRIPVLDHLIITRESFFSFADSDWSATICDD
jgi:DNA repair protein RadC